jgi:hypothetical protein
MPDRYYLTFFPNIVFELYTKLLLYDVQLEVELVDVLSMKMEHLYKEAYRNRAIELVQFISAPAF